MSPHSTFNQHSPCLDYSTQEKQFYWLYKVTPVPVRVSPLHKICASLAGAIFWSIRTQQHGEDGFKIPIASK